jgi:hypothetical protein
MPIDTVRRSNIDNSRLIGPPDLLNPFINPEFRWWQRGTSLVAPASNTYFADRWVWVNSSAAVANLSLNTVAASPLVVGGPIVSPGMDMTLTTADASIAAGDLVMVQHRIEGYTAAPFLFRQITIGFFVRSTVTGTYCVSLVNSGSDRCIVVEYTVNASNTWEWKTVTFPALASGGTWNNLSGVGLYVSWALASGTTFHVAPNVWQASGGGRATANQVNAVSSTSNTFRITGVSMAVGPTIPMYSKPRHDELELMLCQRYYEKSYAPGSTPGTDSSTGLMQVSVDSINTNQTAQGFRFKIEKYTTPTVTIYSKLGNSGIMSTVSYVNGPTSAAAADIGTSGWRCILATGYAANTAYCHHFTAVSEL